jgi:phosphate starvation-inducible PhoH-like protein
MTRPKKDRQDRKAVGKDARLEKARGRLKALKKPHWEPTDWQREAQAAFRQCDVLVLAGFPGTAKTACAVWLAVEEFLAGRSRKLYLLRPNVEAGPSMGHLPGDVLQKLDPYLRPVFEFLSALGLSGHQMIKDRTLEVVAVQHAKGRTFHGGTILLDEAQDCRESQLRLVFSRMGANAKLIVTGDPNQADIPDDPNPFRVFVAKAAMAAGDPAETGFKLFRLGEADVLRHEMVPKLLKMCGVPK